MVNDVVTFGAGAAYRFLRMNLSRWGSFSGTGYSFSVFSVNSAL
jgi:hypothetical protein